MQRTFRFTPDGVRAVVDAWCERFAARPAYWTIDGRPVLSLLNVPDFAAVYGARGLASMLELLRARVAQQLGRAPFLVGVLSRADARNLRAVNGLPIDAATGYALLPDWLGPPVQRYEELIERRVREWHRLQPRLDVPFLPVVCAGWDASTRGERVPDLLSVDGFPWRPVVVGVTPELFGRFLDDAIAFNDRWHPDLRVVFLHAWNEWTEGSAIEPSDRYGDAFLREVAARSGRLSAIGRSITARA